MQKFKIKEVIARAEEKGYAESEKEKEILKDMKWYTESPDALYEDEDNIPLRDNMDEELHEVPEEYPYNKLDLHRFLDKIGYPDNEPHMRYPNRN